MTISRVQSNGVGTNTAGTSIAGTVTAGVTLNNLVVALVKDGGQNQTITPPDASWQLAVRNSGSAGVAVTDAIYYLVVDAAHAGQTSWTWAFGGSHTMFVLTSEWHSTGGWPANPVDKTATNLISTAATTLLAGTTATTTQGEELWIALWNYNGVLQTASGLTSGWTLDASFNASSTNSSGQSAYEIASATGAAAPSITITTAEVCAGAVATFKDNLGNLLASPSRARFQTRVATLSAPSRSRFLTRALLTTPSRSQLLTRALLSSPSRARFLTRIATLSAPSRARFLTRIATLSAPSRARFLTRALLSSPSRARFLTRALLSSPSRARFLTRIATLSAPSRARFQTRVMNFATGSRARFQTRALLSAPSRARFQTRALLSAPSRARFQTRVTNLATGARTQFQTRIIKLGVWLDATFKVKAIQSQVVDFIQTTLMTRSGIQNTKARSGAQGTTTRDGNKNTRQP